ncbi:Fructosamine/Ketosamine-3-kinase [Lasiosphaeria miniovina]|uniref:protein-ribulosamine 3-kinase n=1 Tax=Lasiosphaeria miniovina TaxID=1954250 RepID=A0AA40DHM6_9PEZI|nr:Fructosamine/Ketosamine-3-kinase [Lasiosphaeria miniovina]KAK0703475.1 Fructosamine/Ketosamine-3-kinase [Lasiosphaeria miniovina]
MFKRRTTNISPVLPDVSEILGVTKVGQSAWAKATRIDVRHTDGSEESYFMKVSVGHHGREALKGEFEATSVIYAITPDFCPKPIAWGSLKTEPNAHFYICKFYTFVDGLPEPGSFGEKLARLHSSHTSPSGKFGFHCATYNGDLPQDNAWCDSWEAFYASGLRHVLHEREKRAGPEARLDALLPALFAKVIPRLLRPLESNGRNIKPSLVHGDLWCGNAGVVVNRRGSQDCIVYDPASFWAHNEYEFGNWRPARNKFTSEHFRAYFAIVPKAEPVADFDDRNALYAVRFNLHAATFFPENGEYLQM